MSPTPETRERRIHLALLVVVAVMVQIGLHVTYRPWWCGDSTSYASPASILYGSGFTKYLGERTPGYPLFLIACEKLAGGRIGWMLSPRAAQVVTWVQSGLAVASVLLVYLAVERLGVRRRINLMVCLIYALMAGPAEFSMLIMSENLCLFQVILATYLAILAVGRWQRGQSSETWALGAGFAYGFAVLVRPNVLSLWLVALAGVVVFIADPIIRRRKPVAWNALKGLLRPLAAGGVLPILIWLIVRFETEGVITLTEMIDLARSSPAYNLFDRVDPKDKVLGDIMVKYYRQTNTPGHVERTYVLLALPEIGAHAGAMPVPVRPGYEDFQAYALYAYIGHVSNKLLLENPAAWAENSLSDFAYSLDFRFDRPPLDDTQDPMAVPHGSVVKSVTGWRIINWLIGAQAPVLLLGYMLTYAALAISIRRYAAAGEAADALITLSVAAVATGTIVCMVSPCILAAYYPRFCVPLTPLFTICSAYALEQGMVAVKQRRRREA